MFQFVVLHLQASKAAGADRGVLDYGHSKINVVSNGLEWLNGLLRLELILTCADDVYGREREPLYLPVYQSPF